MYSEALVHLFVGVTFVGVVQKAFMITFFLLLIDCVNALGGFCKLD